MKAKDFAEQYAGTKWFIRGIVNATYTATIIGYLNEGDSYLVVAPIDAGIGDPVTGHKIVELYPEIRYYDNASIPGKRYWSTPSSCIEQIIEAPLIIVKPYPHMCKRCHKPARKVKDRIFCSNNRCKSWQKIKKVYRAQIT